MTENLLAQHSDLVGTVPGRIVCTRLSPVTRKRRCRQLSIASTTIRQLGRYSRRSCCRRDHSVRVDHCFATQLMRPNEGVLGDNVTDRQKNTRRSADAGRGNRNDARRPCSRDA